jgi:hypothetical protein
VKVNQGTYECRNPTCSVIKVRVAGKSARKAEEKKAEEKK